MALPPFSFANTFSFIFFSLLILLPSIPAGNSPVHHYDSQHAIAVNCGFPRNSTALNGRQWVGETDSATMIIFHGPASQSVSPPFSIHNLLDPTPYRTARASRASFTYSFHVGSGYKFIRLHFYPVSYSGFKASAAFITVKSGPYTLLNNFSAFLTADSLGLKSIVKEFTLYVPHDDEPLSITFSPSRAIPSDDETFAFVNGIEVVPMPPGLYYTMEGDVGVHVVGQNYRLPIGKATAMEMTHRLNIGGSSLTSAHDTSMFREWTDDSNHLIESSVFSIKSSNRIKYTDTSKNGAPQRVYQSSWSMNRNTKVGERVSFTWKLPVDLGFKYLIRLHFCELDYEVKESGQKEFSILINNKMVEPRGDLIRWGGEIGVAIYKDYLVTVRGDRMMGMKDLLVALYPGNEDQSTEFIDAVLKGIEVFKLSNPDDNLAGVNPVISHPHAPINHILKMPTTTGRNYIATLVIIVITLLNVIVYQICEWREKSWSKNISPSLPDEEFCRRFSFGEILSATNNFDKELEIGHGGFGKVYKGVIDRKTETVAIKRLSSESKQGEKEFWSEIDILSKLRHKHLVSLIGYCNEGREMILVYEYMEHGTLAYHLHKNKRDGISNGEVTPLSWEQRLNVCLDAARGLDYLHTNSETIHRDVKSENILLDRDWMAKIADFGICKVGTTSNTHTHISTEVKGTFGYLDPEYYSTHRLTKKSDVYAFGVVLWEALCGRPALDTRIDGEQRSLVLWVQRCFKLGIVDAIIDSSLREQISTPSLKLYVDLANQCLHNQTIERPTMAEVTHGLESVLAAATSQVEEEGTDVSSDFDSDREYNGTEEIDVNSSSLPPSTISSTSSQPMQLDDNDTQQKKNKTKLGKMFQKNFQALVRSIDIRRKKSNDSVMKLEPCVGNVLLHFRRFSLDEIRTATHNFSNVIRTGGLSKCYKGMIDEGTTPVIIKQRKQEIRSCINELLIMSRFNHPNIVNFIGYCYEYGEMLIVLEYVDNGSLYDHLYDKEKNPLPWKKRLEICIGAAHGLHYLHSEMLQTVIHPDFISANILIDSNWVAKISGLDLASTALRSSTYVTGEVRGTSGYIDPEYIMAFHLTPKSNVYSFGVVLLEVLCAKSPCGFYGEDGSSYSIVEYFSNIIRENRIDKAMDPYLVGRIAPDCLIQYLQIAMNCVKDKGIERPSMEAVLTGLSIVLELQKRWQFDVSLDPLSGPTESSMDSTTEEWFRMAMGRAYNNIMFHGSSESEDYLPPSVTDLTCVTLGFSTTESTGSLSDDCVSPR
ncbi:putative receptor-like protein kinase At5g39000 [Impatiens glandulifera]|uniref:putative receptor-like protein kinase At5g39000 n=1 Tax=Impatiens glandulifera TaxID=253017 RepID=UPI001FB0E8DE|nr:putative receptor-like protein kinase At5g39000 [Impatiens glandulifera]